MSDLPDDIRYLGKNRWRATAPSGLGAPKRWWLDGVLIEPNGGDTIDVSAPRGNVPWVQVRDDDAEPTQVDQGWHVVLEWYVPPGSAIRRHEIDRDTGSGFSRIARKANDGRGHFAWHTAVRPESQQETYRVRGIDAAGNEVTLFTKTVELKHAPDVPRWDGSRNSDGTVDLSEAA